MRCCILLSFILTSVLSSQEKVEKPSPQALFSIMLWNTQGSQNLAYAPWGNELEENATIVPFTVSSGMPSKKCSFYGLGELNLLRQKEPYEFDEGENPYESVSKIRLASSSGKPSDSLLLLTPSAEEANWKVRNLSFDEKTIPKGHFTFSSQLASPVGLVFGESKFTLSRGKTEKVKASTKDKKGEVMELSAYLPKNGKYEKVFSRKWPYSPELRGMYFIGMQRKRIRVSRIVEFSSPMQSTLGFGLSRVSTPILKEKPIQTGGEL